MIAFLKALQAILSAIPALREIIIDLAVMAKTAHAHSRRKAKDDAVNQRIDSILAGMRDGPAR